MHCMAISPFCTFCNPSKDSMYWHPPSLKDLPLPQYFQLQPCSRIFKLTHIPVKLLTDLYNIQTNSYSCQVVNRPVRNY